MIGLSSHVPTHAAASLSFEFFKNIFTLFQYLSRYSLYSCFSHSSVSSFSKLHLVIITVLPLLTDMEEMALVLDFASDFKLETAHHEKHHSRSLEKDLNVVDFIADSGHQESSTVALWL